MTTSSSRDFIRLTVGAKDVYGWEPSWERLQDSLRRYSLAEVLEILTRISSVLSRFSQSEGSDYETQLFLCDNIFGPDREFVFNTAQDLAQRANKRDFHLFHPLQVVNTAKAAFLTLDLDDRIEAKSWTHLGQALLIMTDLINALVAPSRDLSTTGTIPIEWVNFFLTNRLFHSGGNWKEKAVRSYHLYLSPKPALEGTDEYVDLPSLAQRITKLEPEQLWASLFFLIAQWVAADIERGVVIGRIQAKPFHERLHMKSSACLQFTVSSAEEMSSKIRKRYTPEDFKPFDILPFAETPVVQVGDFFYCPSVKLLKEKVTSGLHHLFLGGIADENLLKAGYSKNDIRIQKDRFLVHIGRVVEEYSEQRVRTIASNSDCEFVSEEQFGTLSRGKKCDGIVLCGASAILVETKASVLPLAVRTHADRAVFESKVKDMFVDAAEQMQHTIDDIRTGVFESLGIKSKHIHNFFPVVITLEDSIMSQAVYFRLGQMIKTKGFLTGDDIKPFQVIDLGELDMIEAAGRRTSLVNLLRKKTFAREWVSESMLNFCFAVKPSLTRNRNARLQEISDHLSSYAESKLDL